MSIFEIGVHSILIVDLKFFSSFVNPFGPRFLDFVFPQISVSSFDAELCFVAAITFLVVNF